MTASKSNQNAWLILLSEYLFIFLPFLVIGIIKIYKSDFATFFQAADWSFAASILFGQVIVKLVSGSVIHKHAQWQRVVVLLSFILVLGLVPSLIVLALILIDGGVSEFLVNMQLSLFCLASLVFFLVGSAAHTMIDEG
ncbi:hypothetical protein ACEWBT_23425 [Vibrio parahaemolyticus]|uniref:Uncharacterized protein n=2 Tax=Vibrio parahaemolyticus TaxID=670 RepID=A0AAW8Q8E9_VIBPH|nr:MULTISPECIES: hypothetical protein [Vibrio]EGQ8527860.1 hypothetical protein [Vibrio parahaemolyticus]EGQ9211864.1 hypothetical protein [Vibrio parahaemolyticus]EGQ9789626.1 hypothetical protein [Vibrio parahaemolyticus]EGQ9926326.1 hypothetical protein [Vibrio parahaemolyticus]EGR0121141.1 hypothetical protein [Vibrio parahaemolyticus]